MNKRRRLTLKNKLKIIDEIVPGVLGKSIRHTAKEYGVSESNIRAWIKLKPKMLATVKNSKISSAKSRLPGGGRSNFFENLEKEIIKWIIECNSKGLSVKEKCVQNKAIELKNEILLNEYSETLYQFKASSGWIRKFKARHNLVSQYGTLQPAKNFNT